MHKDSSITVNGQPLVDVLAKEASNELHEAVTSSAPRIQRRSSGSKHKAFTNGISRNLNLPDKDEPDFTQWVIMGGVQYLRAAKEPIDHSGRSLLGALQYDPETDKIKCHECGGWFLNYGLHRIANPGHPSARRYKKRHGFRKCAGIAGLRYRAVVSEKTKRRMAVKTSFPHLRPPAVGEYTRRRRRAVETQNVRDHCDMQLPVRVKALAAQLGRTPTRFELRTAGISRSTLEYKFGSISNAMRAYGLSARISGSRTHTPIKLANGELIDRLISFRKIHGVWPLNNDLRKSGFMPNYSTYLKRFGGLPQAIAKAEIRLAA